MTKSPKATIAGDDLLTALGRATDGLLFPSESDAPLTPLRWHSTADEPLSPTSLLFSLGLADDAPIETTTIAETLGPFAEVEEGASPEDVEEAKRFAAIIALFTRHLTDVQVYRVGKVDIDVYLLGRDAEGAWIGLKTHAVET